MVRRPPPPKNFKIKVTEDPVADILGTGSVQDSQQADYGGNDGPFWDSVNGNIKNLRAIISGHGKLTANSR